MVALPADEHEPAEPDLPHGYVTVEGNASQIGVNVSSRGRGFPHTSFVSRSGTLKPLQQTVDHGGDGVVSTETGVQGRFRAV
jgi:hypothetical protein